MLVESSMVEQRYDAVREVLDGATARRRSPLQGRPKNGSSQARALRQRRPPRSGGRAY